MKIQRNRVLLKFAVLPLVAILSAATGIAQVAMPVNGVKSSNPNSTLMGDAASTASAIRSTTPATREQLAMQVEKNIEAGQQALQAARRQESQLDDETKTELKTAVRDAFTAQRRLHKSLKGAERASLNEWEQARAELASDYEAYIQAVAQVERLAAGEIDNRSTSPR